MVPPLTYPDSSRGPTDARGRKRERREHHPAFISRQLRCYCNIHISLDLQPLDIEDKIHYHLYILIMQMRLLSWLADPAGKPNFISGDYNYPVESLNCNKLITLFHLVLTMPKESVW